MAVSNMGNPDPRLSCESATIDYAEIVVVRHGETAWNAEGRVQVADRLSKESAISAVYSSDLKRALETAQIIARKCGVPEVIQDPNLRERHLGDLQGFLFHEAARLRPNSYQINLSARTDQEIPGGGESLDQLFGRCTSSLQSIGMKHKGERVVVVTHGGVLRALHRRAAPTERLQRKIMNASVNILHLSSQEEWIIKTWGDISHINKTTYQKRKKKMPSR